MQAPNGLWFLNHHATVAMSHADNADSLSVVSLRMAKDDGPPLHVHHDEDEVFHVLEGQVKFRVGDRVTTAAAGQTLLGPQGVPHGFRVVSEEARMLVVTKGGFERLVRAASRPALHDRLPEFVTPTPAMQAELASHCAALRIELLGPPIA